MKRALLAVLLLAGGCGTVLDPTFYESINGPHWTRCRRTAHMHKRPHTKLLDSGYDYRSHRCWAWSRRRAAEPGTGYEWQMWPAR